MINCIKDNKVTLFVVHVVECVMINCIKDNKVTLFVVHVVECVMINCIEDSGNFLWRKNYCNIYLIGS